MDCPRRGRGHDSRAALFAGNALTRLRGFALENSDFPIFCLAKYLKKKDRRVRFWSKTPVVKTYPIPKRTLVMYAFWKLPENRFPS
jgi:hypothetical protein